VALSSGLFAAGAAEPVALSAPAQIEGGIAQLHDAAGARPAVVSGDCLAAMSPEQRQRLCAACLRAETAVFCRLSPAQKAELVRLVAAAPRNASAAPAGGTGGAGGGTGRGAQGWARRLARAAAARAAPARVVVAIGDGANDVAMIQAPRALHPASRLSHPCATPRGTGVAIP